jgi:hypothetical protein
MEALILFIVIFTFTFLGILIWLIGKFSILGKRVRHLESIVYRFNPVSSSGKVTGQTSPSDITSDAIKVPDPDVPVDSADYNDYPLPVPGRDFNAYAEKEHAMPTRRSRTKEEWEMFIGGQVLNKIGALALTIGVGFFLKYAFDKEWITETFQVLIGGGIGIGLLLAAYSFHKRKYEIFAQGLVIAGISILYLSAYASFNFYSLVSHSTALVLMSLVTVIVFLHAMRYNSFIVSLFGLAGGFLTPVFLSTDTVVPTGLFIYLILLNLGLFFILYAKQEWITLAPISLSATYVLYGGWHFDHFNEDVIVFNLIFLSVIWILYILVELYFRNRMPVTYPYFWHALGCSHAIVLYLFMYSTVNQTYDQWTSLLTVLFMLVYGIIGYFLMKRESLQSPDVQRYLLIAILFSVIAGGIQYTGFTKAVLWASWAVIVLWSGYRWQISSIRVAALGIFTVSLIYFLLYENTFTYSIIYSTEYRFLLSDRAVSFMLITCALTIGGILSYRNNEKLPVLSPTVHALSAIFVLYIFMTTETVLLFNQIAETDRGNLSFDPFFINAMVLVSIWSLYAIPIMRLGLRYTLSTVYYTGIGVLGLAFVYGILEGLNFRPVETFAILFNIRNLALATLITGLIVIIRSSDVVPVKYLKTRREMKNSAMIVIAGILLFAVSLDIINHFGKQLAVLQQSYGNNGIHGAQSTLHNLQQLSLSMGWLMYSIGLMLFGILKKLNVIRMFSIGVFGLSILKVFIVDLSFLDTGYRIISFIGLGIILIISSYYYQKYKTLIL